MKDQKISGTRISIASRAETSSPRARTVNIGKGCHNDDKRNKVSKNHRPVSGRQLHHDSYPVTGRYIVSSLYFNQLVGCACHAAYPFSMASRTGSARYDGHLNGIAVCLFYRSAMLYRFAGSTFFHERKYGLLKWTNLPFLKILLLFFISF